MTALGFLINISFTLYILLFFARAFFPAAGIGPYHPSGRWVYRATDPLLGPIRERMPSSGVMDWSPTVAIIALIVTREIVLRILYSF